VEATCCTLTIDVACSYYIDAGRGGSNAAKTLENVEYSMSNLRTIYMRDTETMPRLARIVSRSSATTAAQRRRR